MRIALAILLLAHPLLAQQPAPSVQQDINREAASEMVFRNPLPPLAKLILHQVETTEFKGRKLVRYSITVNGPAKTGTYTLMLWDIQTNSPVIAFQGIKIDPKGNLRCVEKTKDCPGGGANNQLVLGFGGMVGQPRRLVLSGADKKQVAMGEVVPFPAIGTDGGCTLEAVLMRANGSEVFVIGSGFQPEEVVKLESSSFGEIVTTNKTVNGIGVVTTMLQPFVKGHEEGKTTITISSSKCHPSTEFNWGAYREEQADPVPAK